MNEINQDYARSRTDDTASECELTDELTANEDKEKYQEDASVNIDAELEKACHEEANTECALTEDLTENEEQQNQGGPIASRDEELDKYCQEETNIVCVLTEDENEKQQQYHDRAIVNIDAESDKNGHEELDIEGKATEDSPAKEEDRHYQAGANTIEDVELDTNSHEGTDIGCKVTEDSLAQEENQHYRADVSTIEDTNSHEGTDIECKVTEDAIAQEEDQKYQEDTSTNEDVEFVTNSNEETAIEGKLMEDSMVQEEDQHDQEDTKVIINEELDKSCIEEAEIECTLIKDLTAQEEDQQYQEATRVTMNEELDKNGIEETDFECILAEVSTAHEEDKQYQEDTRVITNEELSANGLEQGKQNVKEKDCDSCGKEGAYERSMPCHISKETAVDNNDNETDTNELVHGVMQLDDTAQVGVEGDKVICGCTSNYSKAPANMERILCTCQKKSEHNNKISQKLSGITDTTQQVMENNTSRKQRQEDKTLNSTSEFKHTVQLNQKKKHNGCTGQGNSGAEKMIFDIGSNSSSDENDTWSLIPLTVQCCETQSIRQGNADCAARSRYILNASQTTEVDTRNSITEIEGLPSTAESTIKQRVNMQDIELRLGAKSVSFHRTDKASDVEVGLGCEERPVSRHASALDKISGILRGLKSKRKPSGYKTQTNYTANSAHEVLGSGIELVDMKGKKNKVVAFNTTNNVEEELAGRMSEDTAIESKFILNGAQEAKEQLQISEEKAKKEALAEQSRLANIIKNTTLSHKTRSILILLLWAIEADMPGDFFDGLCKSKLFNTLLIAKIGMSKELILDNMINPDN